MLTSPISSPVAWFSLNKIRIMLARLITTTLAVALLGLMPGCSVSPNTNTEASSSAPSTIAASPASPKISQASSSAEILSVSATGSPGDYTFAVTVNSPDTGCDRYADWWEVLSEQGELLYRRVLLHSHANEQPFTRSGSPVAIQPTQVVIVRAHLHPNGYGTQAQRGTVAQGFNPVTLPKEFAAEVEKQNPQPPACNF